MVLDVGLTCVPWARTLCVPADLGCGEVSYARKTHGWAGLDEGDTEDHRSRAARLLPVVGCWGPLCHGRERHSRTRASHAATRAVRARDAACARATPLARPAARWVENNSVKLYSSSLPGRLFDRSDSERYDFEHFLKFRLGTNLPGSGLTW